MSTCRMNTYVSATVGGTTPAFTLTPADGTVAMGNATLTSLSSAAGNVLTLVMDDAIADRPAYLPVGIPGMRGSLRYALVSPSENGTYSATIPGLLAYLAAEDGNDVVFNFEVSTIDQTDGPNPHDEEDGDVIIIDDPEPTPCPAPQTSRQKLDDVIEDLEDDGTLNDSAP